MKIIPVEKTDLTLKEAVSLTKNGPLILTKAGKPLAALRSLSGSDWESVALANSPKFQALIAESRRSVAKKGSISLEQIRRELGLKNGRSQKKRAGPVGK